MDDQDDHIPTERKDAGPAADVAAEIIRLMLAILSVALVGGGAWMHYPPLGPLAAGALLFIVVLIGTLRAR
ncbi:MAG: hypothetical protein IKE42_15095 [Aquamicrobium sp.]|nr:hypothetical protein [Aquamicrobium sp.]